MKSKTTTALVATLVLSGKFALAQPAVADSFIYPVRGISTPASNVLSNITDPRNDGWYVTNDVGSICDISFCCAEDANGNCYTGHHPGEDYNLGTPSAPQNDVGQAVHAVANG